MAEVTGLRNNALPYPIYGAPWGVTFPIFDADGDLVDAAADLDSEISMNGNTFADCVNEATEIATASGMYYLLLTAVELTTDVATIIVKTSTAGAKTTPIVLYPRKLVPIRSGTAAGGDTGYITLDASASGTDDYYNGMVCVATIDGTVEARMIDDYNGTNQQASVTPDWNTAPDSDDTFVVYLPEGVQITQSTATVSGTVNANVVQISGDSTAADNCETAFDGGAYNVGGGAIVTAARTVEGTYDELEVLKILISALAGKTTGGGTTSVAFRDTADSKDRITATVDASGNRSAVTLDVS